MRPGPTCVSLSSGRFSCLTTRAASAPILLRPFRNSMKTRSKAAERHRLLQELRNRGIRITAQRRAIIEVMQESEGHLDAATLLTLARNRDGRIDRATVYRTLDLLKSLRLIDELDLMHLEGEKHFYEAKPNVDHMHLACVRCGRIEEFASPLFDRLKTQVSRQRGFQVRVARLEVGGLCRKCRTSAAGNCVDGRGARRAGEKSRTRNGA